MREQICGHNAYNLRGSVLRSISPISYIVSQISYISLTQGRGHHTTEARKVHSVRPFAPGACVAVLDAPNLPC